MIAKGVIQIGPDMIAAGARGSKRVDYFSE